MSRLDELTVLNRRCRDGERERELVALRHQAGLQRLREASAPVALEASEQATAARGSIPEVRGASLDASVIRSAIKRDGSLLVRGLLSTVDVERLVSVIEHVFTSFDSVAHGGPLDDWYSPFPRHDATLGGTRTWLRTKGGVLTGDSPRGTFEVAEVFRARGIDRLAEEYLGQPPVLALDKWTLRCGRAENGIEWHQDGAFLGVGVRALNVWIALSECGESAPSLDVVPRRLEDIVATGTEGASYPWSVGNDVAARVAGSAGWRRPHFQAGDALLFDDKLLHRTGADPEMQEPRYAIETWFFAPSAETTYVEVPLVL